MSLQFPHVRTLADALEVHGLDFLANLLAEGKGSWDILQAAHGRFPNLLTQSYRALLSRAQQSVDTARQLDEADPSKVLPRGSYVVNPTLQYPFEYRTRIVFEITYRNGRKRQDEITIVTRSNVNMEAGDIRRDVEDRISSIAMDPDYEYRFGKPARIEPISTTIIRAERNPNA